MPVKNKKAETPGHNLTNHLIAHFLEMMDHKAELEADFGDYIADVFDWKTGLAYETQTIHDKKAEKAKLEKALLHGEINDVIFIHLRSKGEYKGKYEYKPQSIMRTLTYRNLKKKIIGE